MSRPRRPYRVGAANGRTDPTCPEGPSSTNLSTTLSTPLNTASLSTSSHPTGPVSRVSESDPERFHRAGWAAARQPYLNAFQYRFALRQAEAACRLAPEQSKYRTTLGVAQYRVGQYQQALATLTQAGPPNPGVPADLAFLAMAQHQLAQKEQARATLARLRETMKEPRWAKEEEARAFLREAEALLEWK